MLFEGLIGTLITALLRGGLYGLFALGLAVSFGLLDIVNIAHPTFVILASFLIIGIVNALGVPAYIALLIVLPIMFLLGIGVYGTIRKTLGEKEESSIQGLVFFFGVLIVLQISMLYFFGSQWHLVDTVWSGRSVSLGITSVRMGLIIVFIVSIVGFYVFHQFLRKTYLGLSIRAVVQNEELTAIAGSSPARTKMLGFGISVALAALAAYFWGALIPFNAYSGVQYLGLAFSIVVLGGIGSVMGCFIGGIIISLAEALTGFYWNPNFLGAIPFVVIILVLLIRPAGLFGSGLRA